MKKEIYGMELGETIKFGRYYEWDVLRVPGGWIFKSNLSNDDTRWEDTTKTPTAVFVPYKITMEDMIELIHGH